MGSSVILPAPGQPTEGPDPLFTPTPPQNVVSFGFDRVGPPSTLYIQRDDRLIVNTWASVAGLNARVGARILIPQQIIPGQPTIDGQKPAPLEVVPGGYIQLLITDIFPTGNRNRNITEIDLLEGYLLDLAVYSRVTPVQRGQLFADAVLARGSGAVATAVQGLTADYLTTANHTTWPGGRIQQSTEGPGWSHSINVPNPAAGVDWTFTAATAQRVLVKSFSSLLTPSATVANRNVSIIVDDGVNTVWQVIQPTSIPASQVTTLSATTTNATAGVLPSIQTQIFPPNLFLEPGWRLRVSTGNLQATDQWSAIWLAVEEWIETN